MKLKSLIKDDNADVRMVGAVVGILVTLIISVLVFYNIAGSIDVSSADWDIQSNIFGETNSSITNIQYAGNATDDTLDQAATFYQIAPIIPIVVVAVVILGYVGRIGGAAT